ncbi:hypothetical protein NQ318_002271 [Aromia moschata]|uniref:Glucose-methanol-choline oxidoreductase C-terminal domain-containing protein n=1 Tax=Aromia moschata TaxID=1265417 RepID=A0AAV8Z3K0_9CUCU|nr:hypothetical protein NQ318_002271 [Aromia moschata]
MLRQMTSTIFHPVGTCKMGPKNDGTAVVDPRLRVHGVRNLRGRRRQRHADHHQCPYECARDDDWSQVTKIMKLLVVG